MRDQSRKSAGSIDQDYYKPLQNSKYRSFACRIIPKNNFAALFDITISAIKTELDIAFYFLGSERSHCNNFSSSTLLQTAKHICRAIYSTINLNLNENVLTSKYVPTLQIQQTFHVTLLSSSEEVNVYGKRKEAFIHILSYHTSKEWIYSSNWT